MSGSITKPEPDPVYAELVDLCVKHGLRVGLRSTVYRSNGSDHSAVTCLEVNSVLQDERSQVTQVALGPGGLSDAAGKALKFLRKKAFIP